MHRTSRRNQRRAGGRAGAVALLLAGALALTACSASDDGSGTAPDLSSGKRQGQGATGGGAPAPDAAAPGTGRSAAPGGEGAADTARPKPEAPDYLSTFALDVDTASYGYARRTLGDGRLPSPGDVRPEEFVNSFRQGYERPKGPGFALNVDGARIGPRKGADKAGGEGSGASDWSLLRVGLATEAAPTTAERPPAALTFVVDISGSMAETGRLDLVRTSLDILTDELRDDDSLALVTFSDEAETRLPMTRLGGNRNRIKDVVEKLRPARSTNVGAGVTLGYEESVEGHRKGATNRVVLLSDALANTGDTEAESILKKIDSARREYGITLFGVGVGSDYGDAFMERLTNKGDGNTTYVGDEEQARKVFVDQLPAHLEIRARDAKAQVAFDRKTVRQFRLIGYENRKVADEDFRDDGVDGGEVGPGHTVTALYAVRLREGASGTVATATVRWLDPASRKAREETGTVRTGALEGPLWGDATGDRLQVAAVAAYFADHLRGGDLPGAPDLSELASRASDLAESTEDSSVRKLATAIGQADRIAGGAGTGDGRGPDEGEIG
ncbi:von Willebrand factor type A domain-containing protein [Streptomyces californicus]|uniref:von Willebrand factor type A domain-containing protein n=2 Tax=Streptomyces TaxID=1883 RepID=A0ABD7CZ77_9ACTN|nr:MULTISPECIES: von Willebrand factor type A domain-containing protein [Streptomyces]QRV27746.1 von Willebrand factor type A domain-containing protein [Streptomyces californicus]QRV36590.1 von Willebrand factor type A domain-containing protein [Streptomyces californicus]QRV41145.1 von Willebrand factor type A domain-containing protein [Streptomyces californicus]QRV47901.1 von Willebrand factor type A domain-containing protein [Streptomyces californicus]